MKNKLEIIQEIRQYRNNQLIEFGDNRVFYTTIQALELEGGKQIYRLIEEFSTGENQSEIREFFYEYENEPVLIGQRNPDLMNKINPDLANEIIPVNRNFNDKEWEQIVTNIEAGIENIKEELKKQAEKIGIDEEEIKGLSEIDLDKKIRDRVEEINQDEEKEDPDIEMKKDEPIDISEEEADKCGILGMNTLDLEQKVGIHGETLRSQIGFNNPAFADIEKLMVIPTYKLKYIHGFEGNIPDTPFMIVGKKSSGQGVEVFPENIARPYKGENNTTTTIGEDNIKRDKPDSIIEFPGSEKSISLRQTSPYGMVEATLDHKDRSNSGRVSLELKNEDREGKEQINTNVQEIVGPHKGVEHAGNMLDEVNTHPQTELENGKLKPEDGDGRENTSSHIHNIEETEEFLKAIQEIKDRAKLNEEKQIIEALKRKLEENEISINDAVEEIIEEEDEIYRNAMGAQSKERK